MILKQSGTCGFIVQITLLTLAESFIKVSERSTKLVHGGIDQVHLRFYRVG
jgi:hypothetical protein